MRVEQRQLLRRAHEARRVHRAPVRAPQGEEHRARAILEVHLERPEKRAADALGALALLLGFEQRVKVGLAREPLDPLGRHLAGGVGKRASLDGRDVVHVLRVAPGEGFQKLDALLDEQTVDVLEEPEPGGGIVEHLRGVFFRCHRRPRERRGQ